ncbi:hypothetical protein [Roseomonas elaeocarpi]|uniref:Uncharacterized protein n=1 Tax=Roseomonas elaeocarpi TaxID=907779 RepID=A0ABV6JP02_9PROT
MGHMLAGGVGKAQSLVLSLGLPATGLLMVLCQFAATIPAKDGRVGNQDAEST